MSEEVWTRDFLLGAGVGYLDATIHDGRYRYHDGPTSRYWTVEADDVIELGRRLMRPRDEDEGTSIIYSRWCGDTNADGSDWR